MTLAANHNDSIIFKQTDLDYSAYKNISDIYFSHNSSYGNHDFARKIYNDIKGHINELVNNLNDLNYIANSYYDRTQIEILESIGDKKLASILNNVNHDEFYMLLKSLHGKRATQSKLISIMGENLSNYIETVDDFKNIFDALNDSVKPIVNDTALIKKKLFPVLTSDFCSENRSAFKRFFRPYLVSTFSDHNLEKVYRWIESQDKDKPLQIKLYKQLNEHCHEALCEDINNHPHTFFTIFNKDRNGASYKRRHSYLSVAKIIADALDGNDPENNCKKIDAIIKMVSRNWASEVLPDLLGSSNRYAEDYYYTISLLASVAKNNISPSMENTKSLTM